MKRGVGLVARLTVFLLLCYSTFLLIGLTLLESDIEEDELQMTLQNYKDIEPEEISKKRLSFCAPPSLRSKPFSCNTTRNHLESILVVGALEFVGSRLVSHLASLGKKVRAVSSQERLLRDEEIVWYREKQLQAHHSIKVEVANLSNQTQARRILRGKGGRNFSEVLYFPPGVGDGGEEIDAGLISTMMSQSLAELVTILEELKDSFPCTRVLLISYQKHLQGHATSHGNTMALYLAWLDTFELLLSTYHNNYHTPVGIFRVANGIHGPWGKAALALRQTIPHTGNSPAIPSSIVERYCWYIKDVVAQITRFLQSQGPCVITQLDHCPSSATHSNPAFGKSEKERKLLHDKQITDIRASLHWAESYTSNIDIKENNVIFTSYFTSMEDPQRKGRAHSPNRFQYMEEFFWSLKELGLRAVVFHDELDTSFQHRVTSHYPKLTFSKVNSLHNRSTNDARFYAYYDYLRTHQDIDKVLLTDISDVVFQRDPFQLMSLLGEWLYVGTDIDIFPNMASMPWIQERLRNCFGNHSVDYGELRQLQEMETVYNAGTIGGSRHIILAALTMIVGHLDNTPQDLNCNMPAVNYVVHKHFFDRVFTGFPLTSRFLRHQYAPRGVYIVHK